MKSNKSNTRELYSTPELCVLEALSEGVICDSATGTIDPWGQDGEILGAPSIF